MSLNDYTFTFVNKNGETIVSTQKITDDFLLGVGFGVYVYNMEHSLEEAADSIRVDGNINLVREFFHDGTLPEDWTPGAEEPKRYVLKYRNVIADFESPDFIQGAHTAFLWLDAPDLKKFTKEIYDDELKTNVIVSD